MYQGWLAVPARVRTARDLQSKPARAFQRHLCGRDVQLSQGHGGACDAAVWLCCTVTCQLRRHCHYPALVREGIFNFYTATGCATRLPGLLKPSTHSCILGFLSPKHTRAQQQGVLELNVAVQ